MLVYPVESTQHISRCRTRLISVNRSRAKHALKELVPTTHLSGDGRRSGKQRIGLVEPQVSLDLGEGKLYHRAIQRCNRYDKKNRLMRMY